MIRRTTKMGLGVVLLLLSSAVLPAAAQTGGKEYDEAVAELAKRYLEEGREIFRHDTFGQRRFLGWKGQIASGDRRRRSPAGVGPGGQPRDRRSSSASRSTSTPSPRRSSPALEKGEVDLADPASTLVLLKANAVVGPDRLLRRRRQDA